MTQKTLLTIGFCLVLALTCDGQKPFVKGGPANKLQVYSDEHYKEGLRLNLNASFLLTGESLLFTAYCFNTFDHSPSSLSTIAYIELIGPGGIPAMRSKINLRNGIGSGDLFLPSSLQSANYTLVAYTQWMRNDAPGVFFTAPITIINPFKKPQATSVTRTAKTGIAFFPEGGHLLAGVENTVGFTTTGNSKISGKVMDDAGRTLAEFSSVKNGIGRFSFIPQADKEYKVIVVDSLKNTIHSTLPKAISGGIALHVEDIGDDYRVTVTHELAARDPRAFLVVHHVATPLFESELNFINRVATTTISKSSLPPGRSQISIFNASNEIEAARVIYKHDIRSSQLWMRVADTNPKTRNAVKMALKMNDTTKTANVSISVRQIGPGSTEDPGPSSIINSDDAALTATSDLYKSESIKFLPEARGNLITGTVVDSTNGPKAGAIVYLTVPARNYIFYASKTDSTGRFYFNTEKIPPSSELVFTINPQRCQGCKIKPDNEAVSDFSSFAPEDLVVDSTLKKIIERRSVLAQIENAYYLQKKDSVISGVVNEPFYGKADKVYMLDDFVRFPSMEDIFIEYIVEVILKKKGTKYDVKVMNFVARTAFDGEPLVLLDGVPLFSSDQIMAYNPLLIQKIEVVGRKYFYGPLEVEGIISMSTYNGDVKNVSLPERVKFTGVQPIKKYFTPDYSSGKFDKIPDYRVQLYWNPEVKVSAKESIFNFYTSDIGGDFEVVVRGVQNDGTPVYSREIIHVAEK